MGRASTNYPRELREQAVLMEAEVRAACPCEWRALGAVDGTRNTRGHDWVQQAEIDADGQPGVTSQNQRTCRNCGRES
jgi:hypothetical protein